MQAIVANVNNFFPYLILNYNCNVEKKYAFYYLQRYVCNLKTNQNKVTAKVLLRCDSIVSATGSLRTKHQSVTYTDRKMKPACLLRKNV